MVQFSDFIWTQKPHFLFFFFSLIKKHVVETNLELRKSIMLHRKQEQIVPLICIMDKI